MEANISTGLTKVKTNVSRAFEEQQCLLNLPSGVQPVSNGFIITAWWIKALRAYPLTGSKSQVNRLSYRYTDTGGMETLNPSGYWVMNYSCKVAKKEHFGSIFMTSFIFSPEITVWLDSSLQLKRLFAAFQCFTSLQTSLSHSKSSGLLLSKLNKKSLWTSIVSETCNLLSDS